MPIIGVNLTAGRDDTVKSFIARSVVDAVAELAGVSLDNIHVVFTDTERSSWAIGPGLLSDSPPRPPSPRPMPYQRVTHITYVEGRRDDYLAWRRHRLYPLLGTAHGFLTTSVVELSDQGLAITDRWRTERACREFEATPECRVLVDELGGVVARSTVLAAGSIADAWSQPAP